MKTVLAAFLLSAALQAALTPEQKEFDFRIQAAFYAKGYAASEWKRDQYGADILNIEPWLQRVRATTTDIEFYEVCAEFAASLRDGHANFILPSSFTAALPVHVDIYDGKIIIDSVSRAFLPAAVFPFQPGDELVAYDGRSPWELAGLAERTVYSANDYARRRVAVQRLISRGQASFPRAHEIGDSVQMTIRRRLTGDLETYTIPVIKSGFPLAGRGTLPTPPARSAAAQEDGSAPAWVTALAELQWAEADSTDTAVLNFGVNPGFPMPGGFQQRLGRLSSDAFFSGTFTADGLRIGFIRIPTMVPSQGQPAALRQFETEMAFFQENTDGLIVDIMRNGGGSACYAEELERRLIPYPFETVGFEVRVTVRFLNSFENSVAAAKAQGAPAAVVARLEQRLQDAERAFRENRGRTGAVPLCSDTLSLTPHPSAYRKPILLLVDEFSASAADAFAAVLQDAGRAKLMGMPTAGLGGTVTPEPYPLGPYSEVLARQTISLAVRPSAVTVPGFPTTRYFENVGVWPDIPWNYMNLDNLVSGYRNFTNAVTDEMVNLIRNPQ